MTNNTIDEMDLFLQDVMEIEKNEGEDDDINEEITIGEFKEDIYNNIVSNLWGLYKIYLYLEEKPINDTELKKGLYINSIIKSVDEISYVLRDRTEIGKKYASNTIGYILAEFSEYNLSAIDFLYFEKNILPVYIDIINKVVDAYIMREISYKRNNSIGNKIPLKLKKIWIKDESILFDEKDVLNQIKEIVRPAVKINTYLIDGMFNGTIGAQDPYFFTNTDFAVQIYNYTGKKIKSELEDITYLREEEEDERTKEKVLKAYKTIQVRQSLSLPMREEDSNFFFKYKKNKRQTIKQLLKNIKNEEDLEDLLEILAFLKEIKYVLKRINTEFLNNKWLSFSDEKVLLSENQTATLDMYLDYLSYKINFIEKFSNKDIESLEVKEFNRTKKMVSIENGELIEKDVIIGKKIILTYYNEYFDIPINYTFNITDKKIKTNAEEIAEELINLNSNQIIRFKYDLLGDKNYEKNIFISPISVNTKRKDGLEKIKKLEKVLLGKDYYREIYGI